MNARRLFAVGAIAAALAVLAGGCLLDSEKAPIIHERGGTINITISGGLTPEYSWDGDKMWQLAVWRADQSNETAWFIGGVESWSEVTPLPEKPCAERTVSSPVRHGTLPEGVQLVAAQEPRLTKGATYLVQVASGPGVQRVFGWVEFTPQ